MKTFDVIALGELNVDLILNRIAGFPDTFSAMDTF